MTQVADWSGWIDNDEYPPRKIPLWEYLQECAKGYSMLPSSWEYVNFDDPDEYFCVYCDGLIRNPAVPCIHCGKLQSE